jgi:hypothetical protein
MIPPLQPRASSCSKPNQKAETVMTVTQAAMLALIGSAALFALPIPNASDFGRDHTQIAYGVPERHHYVRGHEFRYSDEGRLCRGEGPGCRSD